MHAIAGAPEAVAALRAAGVGVGFVTNDPVHSRADQVARLAAEGFHTEADEFVTAGRAAAMLAFDELGAADVVALGSQAFRDECVRGGADAGAGPRRGRSRSARRVARHHLRRSHDRDPCGARPRRGRLCLERRRHLPLARRPRARSGRLRGRPALRDGCAREDRGQAEPGDVRGGPRGARPRAATSSSATDSTPTSRAVQLPAWRPRWCSPAAAAGPMSPRGTAPHPTTCSRVRATSCHSCSATINQGVRALGRRARARSPSRRRGRARRCPRRSARACARRSPVTPSGSQRGRAPQRRSRTASPSTCR